MKTIYALAAVLCAYLSATDPSDTTTTATQDGIAATRADMHTEAAKQRACGPNASWRDIDETTIQCVTKKNKPTKKEIL
mgnify:CR=1 FL=1